MHHGDFDVGHTGDEEKVSGTYNGKMVRRVALCGWDVQSERRKVVDLPCFESGDRAFPIFEDAADYDAFERILLDAGKRMGAELFSFCMMPDYRHPILRPLRGGDPGRFRQRVTTTSVRRWDLHRHTVGTGHLYRGTYKSFPIEEDDRLFTVPRDVERNPVRPTMVKRAEDWT